MIFDVIITNILQMTSGRVIACRRRAICAGAAGQHGMILA